ncbi:hypothetical protein [Streptomyces roseochromogenus]|nr:hypothetical protein [Streptomyces roseochromogenus]
MKQPDLVDGQCSGGRGERRADLDEPGTARRFGQYGPQHVHAADVPGKYP